MSEINVLPICLESHIGIFLIYQITRSFAKNVIIKSDETSVLIYEIKRDLFTKMYYKLMKHIIGNQAVIESTK